MYLTSSLARSSLPPLPRSSLASHLATSSKTSRQFMSSSARHSPHRRRSHSASSPLPSPRHFAGDKWRPASKRARPSSLRSPSYKDSSSDEGVDICRREKRARRDSSVRSTSVLTLAQPNSHPLQSPTIGSRGPCLFGSSPVFREEWASVPSLLPPSAFPSTSEAFQLFPNRPRTIRGLPHHPSPASSTRSSVSSGSSSTFEDADVSRLRSTAFWELQRSITENGEGLVSRMRDWEEMRSHPALMHEMTDSNSCNELGQIKKRSVNWTESLSETFEEEDDNLIQIIPTDDSFEDSALSSYSHPQTPSHSAGTMDIDDIAYSVCLGPDSGDMCSSPTDESSCLSSGYASEDDSTSSNSSRISLALHHANSVIIHPEHFGHPAPSAPSSASPSEKAIAALTLVMANGAGGLNDYEAVRSLEDLHFTSLDDSLVGEMWN